MEHSTAIKRLEEIVEFLNQVDIYDSLRSLEDFHDDVKEVLEPHWSIQSSDEQYSDPEMWDFGPLYDDLKEPLEVLRWIDNWHMEEEGFSIVDLDQINDAKELVSKALAEFRKG